MNFDVTLEKDSVLAIRYAQPVFIRGHKNAEGDVEIHVFDSEDQFNKWNKMASAPPTEMVVSSGEWNLSASVRLVDHRISSDTAIGGAT